MRKSSKPERDASLARLREWLTPGDTVYTVLRHVSRSGMQREIGIVLLQSAAGTITDLHPNYAVSQVLGLRRSKGDGVIISGCGMDMGFAIVYELGRALWPDGFTCAGDRCRSNDHSNGDRDRTPHRHADGGYALNHRWL